MNHTGNSHSSSHRIGSDLFNLHQHEYRKTKSDSHRPSCSTAIDLKAAEALAASRTRVSLQNEFHSNVANIVTPKTGTPSKSSTSTSTSTRNDFSSIDVVDLTSTQYQSPSTRSSSFSKKSSDPSALTILATEVTPNTGNRKYKANGIGSVLETVGARILTSLPSAPHLETPSADNCDYMKQTKKLKVRPDDADQRFHQADGKEAQKTDRNVSCISATHAISSSTENNDKNYRNESSSQTIATTSSPSSSSMPIIPIAYQKKRSFHDQILYTMLTTCRPYSLKSLATACSTTVEALQHAMLSFLDKGVVICKEFPSKKGEPKKLYWANPMSLSELFSAGTNSHGSKIQGSATYRDLSKLLASSDEILGAHKLHNELEGQLQSVMQDLNPLLAIPTLKQMDDQISEDEKVLKEVERSIKAIQDRMSTTTATLSTHSNTKEASKTSKDPQTLKRRINNMLSEYKTRKRKCMDFVNELADAMERKVKDVLGEKVLSIETDEIEWGCWEDRATHKIQGKYSKQSSGTHYARSSKGGTDDTKPLVIIPAKYTDV